MGELDAAPAQEQQQQQQQQQIEVSRLAECGAASSWWWSGRGRHVQQDNQASSAAVSQWRCEHACCCCCARASSARHAWSDRFAIAQRCFWHNSRHPAHATCHSHGFVSVCRAAGLGAWAAARTPPRQVGGKMALCARSGSTAVSDGVRDERGARRQRRCGCHLLIFSPPLAHCALTYPSRRPSHAGTMATQPHPADTRHELRQPAQRHPPPPAPPLSR